MHVVFISHTVYTYTVTDFGDFPALPKPLWSVPSSVCHVVPRPLTPSLLQELGGKNLDSAARTFALIFLSEKAQVILMVCPSAVPRLRESQLHESDSHHRA